MAVERRRGGIRSKLFKFFAALLDMDMLKLPAPAHRLDLARPGALAMTNGALAVPTGTTLAAATGGTGLAVTRSRYSQRYI